MVLMIAAIEKCAIAEFDGAITCVIFLQGCDMKCSYCQNSALIKPYSEKAMEATAEEIIEEIPWDEIDAISITGGEPLWSALGTQEGGADLMRLLMHARDRRKKTNIDTNGNFANEEKMRLLEHVAPYLTSISVDIKYGAPPYINQMAMSLRKAMLFSQARFRMVLFKGRWQPKNCIESGISALLLNNIRLITGVRNENVAPMMTDEECKEMKEAWHKLGIELVIK